MYGIALIWHLMYISLYMNINCTQEKTHKKVSMPVNSLIVNTFGK